MGMTSEGGWSLIITWRNAITGSLNVEEGGRRVGTREGWEGSLLLT